MESSAECITKTGGSSPSTPAGTAFKLVTVSGRLAGTRNDRVGEAAYVFPVVTTNASHVWTAEELRSGKSNFSFGVGVGVIR